MPRTTNENYRSAKKSKILESARLVFCRKGFLDVSMQDIIDECGISRGGIYLYFSSVEEIFLEVIKKRNKEKFAAIRKSVDNDQPFAAVFFDYIALQKDRLLHMEESLLRPMYEYIFSRAAGVTPKFRGAQLDHLRKSVVSILLLGVKQKVLAEEHIRVLADHFIVMIEGLSVMALSEVLTEKIIGEQFAVLEEMIDKIRL